MKIGNITDADIAMFHQCLDLDAASGRVFWKEKISKKTVVGKEAGSIMELGYRIVQIRGEKYLTHRVIYAMVHGSCPGEIDHINGNPSDNRPDNLRVVSRSQQNMNRSLQANNTSGFKGVYWFGLKNYWAARIKVDGKYKCLGYFRAIEDAADAYAAAAEQYYGEYRRAYA
jgi:hypothetical protein